MRRETTSVISLEPIRQGLDSLLILEHRLIRLLVSFKDLIRELRDLLLVQMDVQTIRDIRDGSAEGNLKGTEAIVVNFTRELMRLNRVSETTFNAGLNEFGEQGLVELTATLGYYSMLACLLNAFDVRPDNGTQPL